MKSIYKNQIRPVFLAYSGKLLLRLISATCFFKIEGMDNFKKVASEKKCILMVWHNRLALVAEIMSKYAPQFVYTAFISNSRDGEMLSILANSYKNGRSIRVAHNSRHQALRKMIDNLKKKNEVMIVTPDGPRGPCYEVKPGVAKAAKETSAVIVPLSWSADRFWKLSTWDKMILPKPFSTIRVVLGNPIELKEQQFTNIKEESEFLQQSLSSLNLEAI